MLMRDLLDHNIPIDEVLDIFGASNFPEDMSNIQFEELDEETKQANLEYIIRLGKAHTRKLEGQ